MREKLLKIINYYGIDEQLKYIHTEYYELDEAIFDYNNAGWDFSDEDCKDIENSYKNHIAEELADIQVMLEQFREYYGIKQQKVLDIMQHKINRQLRRIEEENKQ